MFFLIDFLIKCDTIIIHTKIADAKFNKNNLFDIQSIASIAIIIQIILDPRVVGLENIFTILILNFRNIIGKK